MDRTRTSISPNLRLKDLINRPPRVKRVTHGFRISGTLYKRLGIRAGQLGLQPGELATHILSRSSPLVTTGVMLSAEYRTKALTLRLPVPLVAQLTQTAKRARISRNALINVLLDRALPAAGRKAA